MGFTNQIKVTAHLLNCRMQPSMDAKIVGVLKASEVHNVVAEQDGWGQLENGAWINLKFTVPHTNVAEVSEIFVTGMSVVEEKPVEVEPEMTKTEAVATFVAPIKELKPEYKLHKVKKGGISGESLWDIAKEHLGSGERYPEIKQLNNLKSDILRAGMVLKIPTE